MKTRTSIICRESSSPVIFNFITYIKAAIFCTHPSWDDVDLQIDPKLFLPWLLDSSKQCMLGLLCFHDHHPNTLLIGFLIHKTYIHLPWSCYMHILRANKTHLSCLYNDTCKITHFSSGILNFITFCSSSVSKGCLILWFNYVFYAFFLMAKPLSFIYCLMPICSLSYLRNNWQFLYVLIVWKLIIPTEACNVCVSQW